MFKKIKYWVSFIFSLLMLGANIFEKIKIFFCLVLFIILFKIKNNFIPFNVKIIFKKYGKNFKFYLHNLEEFFLLKEILIDEEYRMQVEGDVKYIVDLGSNIGVSLVYYSLKYPNAKIFGFEPDPKTYEILLNNIKQFPNVSVFNQVISDRVGHEKFYISKRNISSSLIQREAGQQYISIVSNTINNLFLELNIEKIDILKFDIEGAEFDVFQQSSPFGLINNMIGEVHIDLTKQYANLEDFLKIFPDKYRIEKDKISNHRFIIKFFGS